MKTLRSILRRNKYAFVSIFCLMLILSLTEAYGQSITGLELKKGSLLAFSQGKSYQTSSGEEYLSDDEVSNRFDKNVLNYVNEMRADPRAFYQKYLVSYIREKSYRFTAQYTHSLRREMFRSSALPAFSSDKVLKRTATAQLDFLAQYKGRLLTHDQGNIGFAARMERAGLHCLAENLYTADDPSALNVVLDLLIDQGIPDFGHRKNLMNPVYTHIGIVSETPAGGRMIVVMDFGCK